MKWLDSNILPSAQNWVPNESNPNYKHIVHVCTMSYFHYRYYEEAHNCYERLVGIHTDVYGRSAKLFLHRIVYRPGEFVGILFDIFLFHCQYCLLVLNIKKTN